MTTFDFIIQLFCLVDHQLTAADQNQQQTQAKLYPSEVVTLALLFSLQGVGHRPFYRWIVTDYKLWFSKLASPKPLVPSVRSHLSPLKPWSGFQLAGLGRQQRT